MKRCVAALTLLVLAVACSDHSPTAPRNGLEKDLSSSAIAATRARRPTPRLIGPRENGTRLPPDLWGGDSAELTVTATGAAVRLFCAHGAVGQPILLDGSGRFNVLEFLVREGGPAPSDETRFRVPARYTGWTDGRTMILTVDVEGSAPPLGPFTLVRGQKSRLGPCPIL